MIEIENNTIKINKNTAKGLKSKKKPTDHKKANDKSNLNVKNQSKNNKDIKL